MPTSPTHPDTPLGWRILLRTLRWVPQGMVSRGVGRLARIPLPRFLRRPLLGGFARAAGARVDEADRPLTDYRSFDDFFTRRLRSGTRMWDADPGALVSPVDGVIGECGTITAGRLIQAKGRDYTAASLLADRTEAEAFDGGLFITIYLSPRHYHRIHTPTAGAVVAARHVPGRLFPVHPAAVNEVAHLFARNERLVCTVEGEVGRVAVVAVGAMNVGRISAAFDPEWAGGPDEGVTNRADGRLTSRTYDPPRPVATGDEIMTFHLGSTVVLLTTPGLRLADGVDEGDEVQVGQVLARRGTGGDASPLSP
ncbi:MAG TPA: archaetidylserine decarboxylase [Longimicrobiales bacterium]|nr:archaetidylserine decarboxylase [Longimicrobiales bacterium]